MKTNTIIQTIFLTFSLILLTSCHGAHEGFATNESSLVSTLSTYAQGDSVAVTFNISPATATDWIAIANATDPDTSYITWAYTGGLTNGTYTVNNLTAGNYEAREYHNWDGTNSYTVFSRSAFTITATSGSVTTDSSTYSSGDPITTSFTSNTPTNTDWISIAPSGSSLTTFSAFLYTGGGSSGMLTFNITLPNGTYVARLFRNNSFALVDESPTFTVSNGMMGSTTLSVPQPLEPTSSIAVSYNNMPGNGTDWLAISNAGAPADSYLRYTFTSGLINGTWTSAPLPAGNYEARAFHNWPGGGFTVQATFAFSVTVPGTIQLISPVSGTIVSKLQPTVRVATGGGAGASVEFCSTRTCSTVLQTVNVTGASPVSATPSSNLPSGFVYFRARSWDGGVNFGGTFTPVWQINLKNRGATPSSAVSSFIDFNADGFEEMATQANRIDRAYVFDGSASGLNAAPSTSLLGVSASRFANLGSAGDLNGDGFGDLATGAWAANGNEGESAIFLGTSTGISTNAALTFTSADGSGALFGASVQGLGDVNGDGFGDLVATAYNASSGAGRAYVYYGSATGAGIDGVADVTLTGAAGDRFGYSVSNLADVNGDGFHDLVVSADGANSDQGVVYVYYGSASGLATAPGTTLNAPGTSSLEFYGFGFSLSSGDVNGDGYSDILVGAPSQDNGASVRDGAAHLYLGSVSGLASSPSVSILSPVANGGFGLVVRIGDINGDGQDDAIVGNFAPGLVGGLHLYVGAANTLPTTATQSIAGTDGIGSSYASAIGIGDYDGDGLRDVAVGAYQVSGQNGIVHVYDGTAGGLNATPFDITAPDGSAGRFGIGIAQ